MAIDKKRYEQFAKDINEIRRSLSFEEFYATFQAKLLDYINTLGTDERSIALRNLTAQIELMLSPEVAKFARDVRSSYNDVLSIVNDRYADIGENVSRDFARLKALEKVTQTRFGAYSKATSLGIARLLKKRLSDGENSKQIAKRIAEKFDGKAQFYADTIAQTAVKGYGRVSKVERARIGEVFFYEYVGIRQATSRPICLALIGSTHHIDQIRKMRNGNLEPVLQYCGGWRCIHDWEPDPFATEGSKGRWQEKTVGKNKFKIYLEDDLERFFDEAA